MAQRAFDLSVATHTEIRCLLKRALAGRADASRHLVDAIAPIVHVRVARSLWKRRSQARGRDLRQQLEDLMQETFVALFANGGRALLSWDPERGLSFANFVGFLAEREVSLLMRTRKHNPWTEDPTVEQTLVHLGGTTESGEARLEARDQLRCIGERLNQRLTAQGRRYFRLLYLEERSVQSIAEETGASTAALYAWRSRLGKLLRALGAELEQESRAAEG